MSENVGKVFNITVGNSGADGVPSTRKINGKPLTEDINLTAPDVGAASSDHTHTPEDIGAAATDHTHTPADIGAAEADHTHTPASIGAASSDHEHSGYAAAGHSHTPDSIGAAAADHTHTPASIGAASANHSHSGYASSSHSHTAADVGALPSAGGTITGDLTLKGSGNYGNKLNFGDGDYVHLYEKEDDCLEIKAKKVNFLLSDTSSSNLTVNGNTIGGGSGGTADAAYGVCTTAESTTAKTVSIPGFSLVTGAHIMVKFTYRNSTKNPTLNVNGTGAKSIMKYGTNPADDFMWMNGDIVEFVYDGTNFVMTQGSMVHAYKLELGGSANAYDSAAAAVGYNAHANAYAIAVGSHASANANAAAFGYNARANSQSSTALGYAAKSNGASSLAVGGGANASANRATALGSGAIASDEGSTAVGESVYAVGKYSMAIGYSLRASGNYSIAIGYASNSSIEGAIAIGTEANVSGNRSTALGFRATTSNSYSIQLGNASALSSLTCKVSLTVTSDERDKADITPIDGGAVDFLRRIKAVRYVFNGREMYIDDENLSDEEREKKAKYGLCAYDKAAHARGDKKGSRIRIGVLAQQIQSALQEVYGSASYVNLVNDNLYDYPPEEIPEGVENQLAVNYEGFIPFLIKAVQELDARLMSLESEESQNA